MLNVQNFAGMRTSSEDLVKRSFQTTSIKSNDFFKFVKKSDPLPVCRQKTFIMMYIEVFATYVGFFYHKNYWITTKFNICCCFVGVFFVIKKFFLATVQHFKVTPPLNDHIDISRQVAQTSAKLIPGQSNLEETKSIQTTTPELGPVYGSLFVSLFNDKMYSNKCYYMQFL